MSETKKKDVTTAPLPTKPEPSRREFLVQGSKTAAGVGIALAGVLLRRRACNVDDLTLPGHIGGKRRYRQGHCERGAGHPRNQIAQRHSP